MKKDIDTIALNSSDNKLTPRQFYLKYKKELEEFTIRVVKDIEIEKYGIKIIFVKKDKRNKTNTGSYEFPDKIFINLQNIVFECYYYAKFAKHAAFSNIIGYIKANIILTLIHEYFHSMQYYNCKYIYSTDYRKNKYIELPNVKRVYLYIMINMNYLANKYNIKRYMFINLLNGDQEAFNNTIKYKKLSMYSLFVRILKYFGMYDDDLKSFFKENILGEKYYISHLAVKINNTIYYLKKGDIWDLSEFGRLNKRLKRKSNDSKLLDVNYLWKHIPINEEK